MNGWIVSWRVWVSGAANVRKGGNQNGHRCKSKKTLSSNVNGLPDSVRHSFNLNVRLMLKTATTSPLVTSVIPFSKH